MNVIVIIILIILLIILIGYLNYNDKNQTYSLQVKGRNPPPVECEPNSIQNLCCTLYNYNPDNQSNINTQTAVYCPSTQNFRSFYNTACIAPNQICPYIDLTSPTCPLYTPTPKDSCYIYTIMVDNTNDVSKFYITFNQSSNSLYLSKIPSTQFNFAGSLSTTINSTQYNLNIDNKSNITLEQGIIGQLFKYNCGILFTIPQNLMLSISNQITSDNLINLTAKSYDPNNLNNNEIMFYFQLIQ